MAMAREAWSNALNAQLFNSQVSSIATSYLKLNGVFSPKHESTQKGEEIARLKILKIRTISPDILEYSFKNIIRNFQ